MAMRTSGEVRFSMLFDVKKGLQKVFVHHSEVRTLRSLKRGLPAFYGTNTLWTQSPRSHPQQGCICGYQKGHSRFSAGTEGLCHKFPQLTQQVSLLQTLATWESYVSMLTRTINKSFTSPFSWWATQYSIRSYHSVNNLVYDQFVRNSNI